MIWTPPTIRFLLLLLPPCSLCWSCTDGLLFLKQARHAPDSEPWHSAPSAWNFLPSNVKMVPPLILLLRPWSQPDTLATPLCPSFPSSAFIFLPNTSHSHELYNLLIWLIGSAPATEWKLLEGRITVCSIHFCILRAQGRVISRYLTSVTSMNIRRTEAQGQGLKHEMHIEAQQAAGTLKKMGKWGAHQLQLLFAGEHCRQKRARSSHFFLRIIFIQNTLILLLITRCLA